MYFKIDVWGLRRSLKCVKVPFMRVAVTPSAVRERFNERPPGANGVNISLVRRSREPPRPLWIL